MTKFKNVADYLNYSHMAAPGVVVGKDKSLMAAWALKGFDCESLSGEEIDARLDRLAVGLSRMYDGDGIWISLERRKVKRVLCEQSANAQLGAILRAENAALSEQEEAYENHLSLALQSHFTAHEKRSAVLEEFESRRQTIENIFSAAFEMRRLGAMSTKGSYICDEFVNLLCSMATGRPMPHFTNAERPLIELSPHIARSFAQDDFRALPIIDGVGVAIATLWGFPRSELDTRFLRDLESLPLAYRWTSRFIKMDRQATKKKVTQIGRRWTQSGTNMAHQVMTGEQSPMEASSQVAINELGLINMAMVREGAVFGRFTSVLTAAYDKEGLAGDSNEARVTEVWRVFEQAAMECELDIRLECEKAFDAFLGSLPGHLNDSRRPLILSANAAFALMPLQTTWQGEKNAPCPPPFFPSDAPPLLEGMSITGEPFSFNIHWKDVGHTLILGPSTAGKSVLLSAIAAHFLRYDDAQVFFFDKLRSSFYTALAFGGQVFEFGADHSTGVAPLQQVAELGEEWTTAWLCEMLRLHNVPVTAQIEGDIAECLKGAGHDDFGFEDLVSYALPSDVKAVFEKFVAHPMLDNAAAQIGQSPFTVFESHELFKLDQKLAVLLLDYLFQHVEKQLESGRPTIIIIDEAHAFLRHTIFEDRIRTWLKEGRKQNASLILATQEINDVVDSNIASSIQENIRTKIYLPNDAAQSKETAKIYRRIGLSEAQIAIVKTMTSKKHYLVTKPDDRMARDNINQGRVVDFRFSQTALSLFGQTSAPESQRAEQIHKKNPQFWLDDLTQKGAAP